VDDLIHHLAGALVEDRAGELLGDQGPDALAEHLRQDVAHVLADLGARDVVAFPQALGQPVVPERRGREEHERCEETKLDRGGSSHATNLQLWRAPRPARTPVLQLRGSRYDGY